MDEIQYEQDLSLLGNLRDHLQKLEETDYMTAYYKGYSTDGQTLAEIKAEIEMLNQQIEGLTNRLDDQEWG